MVNSPIVSRINSLLAKKGISKQDFYKDCNITSASYSFWNTGKTTPRMKNLEVIAKYLGTTVEYLLTGLEEKEKAPVKNDERNIEQAKIALFGGGDEVTDEMWEEAVFAAQLIKDRHKRKMEKND